MRDSRSTLARRGLLAPSLALALAVVAGLLFTWPLLREPRLHVLPAFIHVLVAWAVVIGALWWISGRPMVEDADSRDRDA
ncbi:MAG TPA: hypothetical protein VF400_07775 [Anaeromyxobacteraceae bacterium]